MPGGPPSRSLQSSLIITSPLVAVSQSAALCRVNELTWIGSVAPSPSSTTILYCATVPPALIAMSSAIAVTQSSTPELNPCVMIVSPRGAGATRDIQFERQCPSAFVPGAANTQLFPGC